MTDQLRKTLLRVYDLAENRPDIREVARAALDATPPAVDGVMWGFIDPETGDFIGVTEEGMRQRWATTDTEDRLPGSCDWGDCDNDALLARRVNEDEWLPVCVRHADDAVSVNLAPLHILARLGDTR
jgi:hypothetical protein